MSSARLALIAVLFAIGGAVLGGCLGDDDEGGETGTSTVVVRPAGAAVDGR